MTWVIQPIINLNASDTCSYNRQIKLKQLQLIISFLHLLYKDKKYANADFVDFIAASIINLIIANYDT